MKRPGRVAWLVGLILAAAAVAGAPALSPRSLFFVSIAFLLLVAVLGATGLRSVYRRAGWTGVLAIAALVAAAAAAVGVDWPARAGPTVPCRRNWAWVPSYLLRPSPTRSVSFEVADIRVKICYGSPRTRGRRMIGAAPVPFGSLWRTGANEPTTIRASGPISVAGLYVDRKASLYTVPGPETWELVLNESTSQWGLESEYTDAIRAREVGRTILPVGRSDDRVEAFTLQVEPGPDRNTVILSLAWERVVLRIPIGPASR